MKKIWPIRFRIDVRAPAKQAVEVLTVASLFVLSTRMWSVGEHIVFLSILFALILAITSLAQESTRWSPPKLNLIPLALLAIMVAIMLSSAAWAPEIHRTLSYAGFSVLQILIGLALSRIVSVSTVLYGVFAGSLGVSFHSFATSISQESFVPEMPLGLFTNESDLSHILGLGVVCSLALVSRNIVKSVIAVAGAGFLLWHISLLTYFTTTVSLASAFAVTVAIFILRSIPPHAKKTASLIIAVVASVLLTLVVVFRNQLQVFAGKTPDFSGRVPFWERFWTSILEKPFFGFGWGWTRDEFGGTDRIVPHNEIFTAHNGFLDVAFALGLPAALLLAISLGASFFLSYRLATSDGIPWIASGIPSVVAYLLVHDLTGSWLPRTVGLFLVGLLFGLIARERNAIGYGDSRSGARVTETRFGAPEEHSPAPHRQQGVAD